MNVTAMEARKKFGELLNRVSLTNEEIIIERSGKKIARLTKVENNIQENKKSGKLDFRKARGLGSEIWKDLDIDEYIKEERNEWK